MLEEIYLFKNNLLRLPNSMYFWYLRELYLNDNFLSEIPDIFDINFENLTLIALSDNCLTALPPSLLQHPHVKITAKRNPLEEPDLLRLDNFWNLRELYLLEEPEEDSDSVLKLSHVRI